jgi:multidrug efflux system outer membrane protein
MKRRFLPLFSLSLPLGEGWGEGRAIGRGEARTAPIANAAAPYAHRILPARPALWLGAALLTLSACTVGPDYQRPDIAAPKKWSERPENLRLAAERPAEWWKSFNDPVLNRLIAEAVAANLDLRQAEARVRDARARREATLATGLPSLDARGNASRRLNSFGGQGGQTGQGGTVPFGGFGAGRETIDIFQMGFDANWELDFFGGVRRAVEAADATVDAEEENRRAVLVTLLGEVARNYIELRGNQSLIEIANANLRTQADTLELTRARQEAGLASQLEVAQEQAQVEATRSQIPVYQTALKQAAHALGVLLGRAPGALLARLEEARPVPAAPAEILADLPSELLRRRPDLRRAERQLAAATAQVGVATAELYPRVNLAAFLGLQNTRITDFTALGKSWSTAASLSMPLFNWGRIQANIAGREAQQEQALLAYRAAVLGAFREVEDALTAYAEEQKRRAALAQSVDASRLAVQLAEERYQKGLTAFLDVLTGQRALFQAESSLVESEARISTHLVALYKALGGGWEVVEEPPAGENPGQQPRQAAPGP